jgi:hypothetical protein
MFHVKHLAILFGLFFPFISLAQGSIQLEQKEFIVSRKKDPLVVQFLSNYSILQKYSVAEQDTYYWVNLLRKDPAAFNDDYIVPFLEQFPSLQGANAQSLTRELKNLAPPGFIAPAGIVQKEAERHALDLALRQRRLSHESSDGRTFGQRMADAGVKNCAGENVFEGEGDALKALILLLIDKGVPNLGHRKALLSSTFNVMGVSCKQSPDSTYYMVQLFSCQ